MIEVGEYYRTESGYIDKIRNIDKQGNVFKDEKGKLQLWLGETIFGDPYSEEITKHSKDIIDLIEVGDYVNGHLIDYIPANRKFLRSERPYRENDSLYKNLIEKGSHYNMCLDFKSEDIKTIVTREQYEQNCYKVGED